MTRSSTARAVALLTGAVLVVVACGSAGSPSGAPGGSQPAGITPAPAGSEGAGFSFVMPSFTSDLELEALLPDEIGGAPTEKLSMSGTDLIGDGSGEDLAVILTQFGKQPSDLSAGLAGAAGIDIIAYRVQGIDANALFQAFLQLIGNEDNVVSDANLGGKAIKKIVTLEGDTSYVYASGDVLFIVEASDAAAPALLEEVFTKLR